MTKLFTLCQKISSPESINVSDTDEGQRDCLRGRNHVSRTEHAWPKLGLTLLCPQVLQGAGRDERHLERGRLRAVDAAAGRHHAQVTRLAATSEITRCITLHYSCLGMAAVDVAAAAAMDAGQNADAAEKARTN